MTIKEFLKAHPIIRNDLTFHLPPNINLKKLSDGINESSILIKMYSLTWLIFRYERILAGHFKDHPQKTQGRKSPAVQPMGQQAAPRFGTERNYTQEDYKNMFQNFDDAEF